MRLEGLQLGGGASVSLPPVKGPLQVQPTGSEEGAACQAVTGLVLAQPSAILCAGVHARVHICKEAREVHAGCFPKLVFHSSFTFFETGFLNCRASSIWMKPQGSNLTSGCWDYVSVGI